MGGLARRVGYEKALSKMVGGQAPILNVDLGHAFTDSLEAAGIMDDPRVKNEWVLRAFEAHRVAAANVSPRDLPYLAELMATGAHKKSLAALPALGRFVSANVLPAGPSVAPFAPYLVEEVRGGRLGKAPLRVGIVGVSAAPRRQLPKGSPYTIADPVEAVRKLAPELRKKVDILVVLAYADRETAQRIGRETEGVDLVLAAHQFPLYSGVDEAGDAVVAYVSNETKYLGEIRFYRPDGAKEGPISSYLHRNVPLDDEVPSDEAALRTVEQARAKFTRAVPAAGR